jgi:hypothetical protein
MFLCYVVSIIRIIKSRRIRWAGHEARMGEKRNAYRILVGKPEGKDHWEDQDVGGWTFLKWILRREIGWDSINWIDLVQDRDQWRALVNTIMKLRVP